MRNVLLKAKSIQAICLLVALLVCTNSALANAHTRTFQNGTTGCEIFRMLEDRIAELKATGNHTHASSANQMSCHSYEFHIAVYQHMMAPTYTLPFLPTNQH